MHDNFSTLDFLIFRTHVRKRLRGYGVRSCQISVGSCQMSVVRGGMERVAVGAAGRQPGAKAAGGCCGGWVVKVSKVSKVVNDN